MNARERFHAIMDFKPFDRLPILEWAMWWDKTIERWKREGMRLQSAQAAKDLFGPTNPSSAYMTERYELYRHFGMDMYCQHWFPHRRPGLPQPASHGAGIISDADGYEAVRGWLFPKEGLFGKAQVASWAERQKEGDCVIWFTLEGFFWFPRALLGIERHLYAFYDQPELMHRINTDLAEHHLLAIDALCEVCQPDFMTFAEDLSYNNGPMLSEAHFDEFLLPYYRRVIPRLKERGIRVFIDSDGDVSSALPWFERAGIEGVLPLERQAGVDIAKLRETHPKMLFIGAFDKMTMNMGEGAMRAEFERLLPVARQGGFLMSCDHQTPPGVSYADYQTYLRLFREYAAKAAVN